MLQDGNTKIEPEDPEANEIQIYDSEWAEEGSSDTDSDGDVQDDICKGKDTAFTHSSGMYLSFAWNRYHLARAIAQSLAVAANTFDYERL